MCKKTLLAVIVTLMLISGIRADEGMWMPIMLEKYTIEEMQKAGFKLTAEDIYSINEASLKDAVVGLGKEDRPFRHFCTANLVSDEGLLLTNHHCSYNLIQSHSSLEHNYLDDGFWAMDRGQELPNEGITASFLIRMEDVTGKVLENVTEDMNEKERRKVIKENSKKLEKAAEKETGYRANIKPFFAGNQYFLSLYEIYKDVRLVGAPPLAIGKFGGDTDNWMWPRHTGDFSVLRIYADKDNKPAKFSKENVPLQPKKSFTISLRGVNEGDFTMVFGYPGTTEEYLTSYALDLIIRVNNPHKIKIRKRKLELLEAAMNTSPLIRIQYVAKHNGIANSWKKWKGELKGLKRFRAISKKQELERQFVSWSSSTPELKAKYGGILDQLETLYAELAPYTLARDYVVETGTKGAEAIVFSLKFRKLAALSKAKADNKKLEAEIGKLQSSAAKLFKNYHMPLDRELFAVLLKMYRDNVGKDFLPDEFKMIDDKFKGDFNRYAQKVYEESIFTDSVRVGRFLQTYKASDYKKILRDPMYKMSESIRELRASKIFPEYSGLTGKISDLQRVYLAGLMQMQNDKVFYPDANSTLRVHYGKVAGYTPRNAVKFKYYTTLSGIMEKENPEIPDYKVPHKLKELYAGKDYGRYAVNGKMPVCFIASNHTTGGNSGSSVLNANGELIGLNFDRAWDGIMSDMMYDPEICRNIIVDIRYVLFIIDKFAGAGHLLDEMNFAE